MRLLLNRTSLILILILWNSTIVALHVNKPYFQLIGLTILLLAAILFLDNWKRLDNTND